MTEVEKEQKEPFKRVVRRNFFKIATWIALGFVGYLVYQVTILYPILQKNKPNGY